MIRILSILLALTVALSACTPSSTTGGKAGGTYRISRSDAGTIQFRMLDSVNALRSSAGVTPLALDAIWRCKTAPGISALTGPRRSIASSAWAIPAVWSAR